MEHMTFSFMMPDRKRRHSWIRHVVIAINITRLELVGEPDPVNTQRRLSDIEKFPKSDRNRGKEILQIFDMDFRLNITEICASLNQLSFGTICS